MSVDLSLRADLVESGAERFMPAGSGRPLRWWSVAQLSLVASRLEEARTAWERAWGLPAPSESCIAELAHEADFPDTDWSDLGAKEEVIDCFWTLAAPSLPATSMIAEALFGEDSMSAGWVKPKAGIAMEVALEAWQDWLKKLGHRLNRLPAGNEPPLKASPGLLPDRFPWSGAVQVKMPWLGEAFYLHLSGHAVAGLLAEMPNTTRGDVDWGARTDRPLVSLGVALAAKRVHLRVKLNAIALEVGSLLQLTPGDMVPLTHGLDAPLRISLEDGCELGSAFLGRISEHKAIELDDTVSALSRKF